MNTTVDLKTIHDAAGNMHLTGHSERFVCDLFVKIWHDKAKFYAEQTCKSSLAVQIFILIM